MNTTLIKDYNAIDGIATVYSTKRKAGGTRELLCRPCAEYSQYSFPTVLDGTGRQCDVCGEDFE